MKTARTDLHIRNVWNTWGANDVCGNGRQYYVEMIVSITNAIYCRGRMYHHTYIYIYILDTDLLVYVGLAQARPNNIDNY